jgi:methylmalonyl-CoA mutase N-terminal domain/subunit
MMKRDAEDMKKKMRLEARQRSRIAILRKKRNRAKAQSAIAALKEGAEGKANLMPLILDAVKTQVSIGEICNTLRGVWGEHDTMHFPKSLTAKNFLIILIHKREVNYEGSSTG